MNKKMLKILALHGNQQNGELFRTRLGRFPNKLIQNKILGDIHYLDAYYELDVIHEEDDIPLKTWYLRDSQGEIIYSTIEQTLSYIENIWENYRGFDVIIGFSMGGIIASIIASQPLRFPGLLCILIGGAPDLKHINGNKQWFQSIPSSLHSMHLMGSIDKVVNMNSSKELAEKFHNPRIVEHEMGHCLPMKSYFMNIYLDFMKEMSSQLKTNKNNSINNAETTVNTILSPSLPLHSIIYYCASDDVAIAQKDELEVLQSMYPSDLTITNNPTILLNTIPNEEPQSKGDRCILIHILFDFSLIPSDKILPTWVGNIGMQFIATSQYPYSEPPLISVTTGKLSLFDGFNESLIKSIESHIYSSIGLSRNYTSSSSREEEGMKKDDNYAASYIAMPCAMICIQAAYQWFEQEMWLCKYDGKKKNCNVQKIISTENSVDVNIQQQQEDDDDIVNDNTCDTDIDEVLEKEQIRIATLEAYRVACNARQSSSDHPLAAKLHNTTSNIGSHTEYDLLSESNLINGGILPPSARGIWNYTVGLVGKPSAGKSTFYNAVTKAALQRNGRLVAEVSPHPFTTIEPNIGPGWYASFHDEQEDLFQRHPLHGKVSYQTRRSSNNNNSSTASSICSNSSGSKHTTILEDELITLKEHRRLLPICVKDVAGLVPGAYKGRGKGNRFLADLCDADVLVHVVDVTGTSDKDGNLIIATTTFEEDTVASSTLLVNDTTTATIATNTTTSSPLEDAEWIREELHRWIYGNIKGKWASVKSKGKANHCQQQQLQYEKCGRRVHALFTGYQGPKWCVEVAAKRAKLNLNMAFIWSNLDIHRIVAHFLSVRFPICLALNKIDFLPIKDANIIISQCQEAARSRGEVAVPVSAKAECLILNQSMIISQDESYLEKYRENENIIENVMERFGSTGVLEAISEAVKLKPPVLCYPVCDIDSEYPVGWTTGCTTTATILVNATTTCPTPSSSSLTTIDKPLVHRDGQSNYHYHHSHINGESIADTTKVARLQDCLQFKTGSTVGDVFEALKRPDILTHTVMLGEFVRSEGRSVHRNSSKIQLRRDTMIDHTNSVLRIQTNRKSIWQKKTTALV